MAGSTIIIEKIVKQITVEAPAKPSIIRVERAREITVVEVVKQGPPGPPGISLGGVKAIDDIMPAVSPMSALRVIISNSQGEAEYADSGNPDHRWRATGVTLQGVSNAGDLIGIRYSGPVDEPSWTWTPGLPIFLGPNGTLTQTRPTVGIMLIVGQALSPTRIMVRPTQPIILS
jgi:hypothetical protein